MGDDDEMRLDKRLSSRQVLEKNTGMGRYTTRKQIHKSLIKQTPLQNQFMGLVKMDAVEVRGLRDTSIDSEL